MSTYRLRPSLEHGFRSDKRLRRRRIIGRPLVWLAHRLDHLAHTGWPNR